MLKFALAGLAGVVVVGASAQPIYFTHEGRGTGTVGDQSFVRADFTITTAADISNIESYGSGVFVNHDWARIEIEGLGSFDFVSGTSTFVNNLSSLVGFSRTDIGGDLFNGPGSDQFGSYGLDTEIGPITGMGQLFQWDASPVETSGGVLFMDFMNNGPATFTASFVPAPASAVLMTLGGLVAARRRR